MLGKEWTKVKDLQIGDVIKTDSEKTETVSEISKREVEIMVYNVEILNNKNYFVSKSKVLVHNKKIIDKKKNSRVKK